MPFTVEDFHDLIQLLETHPEWRSDLRRLVLTDELLALPQQLAMLQARSEEQFQELLAAQQRTDAQMTTLTEQVTALIAAPTTHRRPGDHSDRAGDRLGGRPTGRLTPGLPGSLTTLEN